MHAPTPFIHSRLTLPLLVLVSMMGPLALNIVMAALPGMVHTLATTREMVQLTISLFLLGQAVSQLFVGPLSDRFGRKPVLTISIGVYVLASLGAGMASDIGQLIVLRVLQAFGATAGLTLARTIVRDLYPRETAASMIGYVTMGMVVAPMIAPSLGAVLDEAFGWRAIFLACALLGLAAIALTLLILKETRPVALTGATAADVLRRSGELLLNRRFLGYAGASTGASAMFYAFLGAAPFIVVDLMHRPPWEYGAWYVVMAFGYMGGNFLSGRFSRRIVRSSAALTARCSISESGVPMVKLIIPLPTASGACLGRAGTTRSCSLRCRSHARSTAPRSSRTLPGHGWRSSSRSPPGARRRRRWWRALSWSMNSSASMTTSSPRSRSAGTGRASPLMP